MAVLPANVQDWDGAEEVVKRCGSCLPRMARVWADAGYRAFAGWVTEHCRWVLDIVRKRPGQTTFEVQKWRWIVERTFGWFGRYRRLSKDYERTTRSSEAWIYLAMMHRMARALLPARDPHNRLRRGRPRRRRHKAGI